MDLNKIKIKNILVATFVFLFLTIAATTFLLIQSNMRAKSVNDAQSRIKRIIDRNLAVHKYFTNVLKPSVFKIIDKCVDKNYFDHVWMSSTFANKQIDKIMKEINPENEAYYYKECAVNARNPENEADTFEAAFIAEAEKDASLVFRSEVKEYAGKPYLVFIRRGEVMEESCVRCHGKPEEAPGDMVKKYGGERGFGKTVGSLLSAISIRVPLQTAYKEASQTVNALSGLLITEFVLLFLVIYLVFKYIIFNQLNKFKSKTDLIAASESELGASVSVSIGSELSELADSFNAMSANLKHYKDTLEDRIRERTAEIEDKNRLLSDEIKEREQAEAELKKSNLVKDKFFSIIGHDLKSLFNNIIGLSEMMDRKSDSNIADDLTEAEKAEYVSIINQSAKNASHLLSNLLNWSQSQTNELAFKPEKFTAGHAVNRSVSEIKPLADRKNIKIKIEGDESAAVTADINMVLTVMRNLLTNAIKFSKPGGAIKISLTGKDGFAEISVIDEGIGMPPEILEKLFNVGEKVVRDGTANEKGTGLGLALCREFVEKNGGAMSVTSREGEGSVFSFTLPLAAK